jgi:acetylornithine aminotransferase/acetylornithine/N-succinyldiaminopimelate aminotransferase
MRHVRAIGEYFRAQLEMLKARHHCVREIRGMGLMLGMELNSADTAKAVVAQLLQEGILINRTQETVLRFLPPYVIQEKHVDQVIQALDSALPYNSSTRSQAKGLTTKSKKRRQRH